MNSLPPSSRDADREGAVRVCFVIDSLNAAGTESQLLALIDGLDRNRVLPHLCLLDGISEVSQSLEPRNCPVLRLGVRSLHRPATLARAWQFLRYLRSRQIDIVHTFFPDSTHFGVFMAKIARVPRVVRTRRNLGYAMTPLERRLGRLYSCLADATVANCEACRQAVIDQEGPRPESVTVIPNGIDLERFAAVPPVELHSNGGLRRVGMVANLRPIKGPDVFVRAAAAVAKSHPNVVFQIAGTGDEESIRRLAAECGILDRLELKGTVRDIPGFLAELDVAVLSSHSEGLSNSLLEYMAACRPIVATAVGGNVELIQDGVHGLLVPPADPESLANAVNRLLQDRSLAASLAELARRRAFKLYSVETMVRRYEEFYRELLKRN